MYRKTKNGNGDPRRKPLRGNSDPFHRSRQKHSLYEQNLKIFAGKSLINS